MASKGYPDNETGVRYITSKAVVNKGITPLDADSFETYRHRHQWPGTFESACRAARTPRSNSSTSTNPTLNPNPVHLTNLTLTLTLTLNRILVSCCWADDGKEGGALYAYELSGLRRCLPPVPVKAMMGGSAWAKINPPSGKEDIAPWRLSPGTRRKKECALDIPAEDIFGTVSSVDDED